MIVVVVDDEPQVRKIVVRVLEGMGHFISAETESAEKALERLSENVDLIVTDWDMPGMSGIDFMKTVRAGQTASWSEVPILMLSGRGETEKELAMKAGANAYLPKPFSLDELRAAVNAVQRFRKS